MMKGNKNKNNKKTGKNNRNARSGHLPLAAAVPKAQHVLSTHSAAYTLVEPAAAVGVVRFMRLNSIYDPDLSGIGVSTIGFNAYLQFFQNFKVRRVTVRTQVQIWGMSTGGLGTYLIAPIARQAALPAAKDTWKGIPYNRKVTLTNSNTGSPSTKTITATFDIAKCLGVTKQQYDIDMDFAGTSASNPAKELLLAMCLDSTGSTTPASATIYSQITYDVEWFNPLPLS